MARPNIQVTDYKSGELDIVTWPNVAKTCLQVSFENERQIVAAGLARLGKAAALVAHKINEINHLG